MKDFYIWEIIWKIKSYHIPSYPFVISGKPKSLLNTANEINYFGTLANTEYETPFSKMQDHTKEYINGLKYLLEGFYFPLFLRNLFSLNNYLSDGLIKDSEIIRNWKAWKEIEYKIEGHNWFI